MSLALVGGEALLPGGEIVRADVLILDGRIADVGADLDLPSDARRIAVPRFAMPGLIDAHTHLTWAGAAPMPTTLAGVAERARENRRRLLDAGVTTVRDVGSLGGLALESAPGPRTVAAGRLICAPGGHGTETAAEWAGLPPLAVEASGPDGLAAAVRGEVAAGAGVIKLTLNAASAELSAAEVAAAVEEAHRLGVRVACHASLPETIDIAVSAGADTIEHGNGASRAQLRRMAQRGIVLVPTLWIYQRLLEDALAADAEGRVDRAWPPPSGVCADRVRAHGTLVADARAEGVTLAAGTDAIAGRDADSLADEILALHRHGLLAVDALLAASAGGAAALGRPELGALSPGAPADVVLFDASPADVVTGRIRPVTVIQAGRVVR